MFLTSDAGHGIAATFVDVLKEVKYNTILYNVGASMYCGIA